MSRRRVAVVLGLLTAAFAARVAGQAMVALGDEPWVAALTSGGWPPMGAWYSGLIPYPVLLPIQAVILLAQAWHVRRWWAGPPAARRPRIGVCLIGLGVLYAGLMLLRYAVAITWRGGFGPPWWAGGLIPVTFHQVLAAYLVTWGAALRSSARGHW